MKYFNIIKENYIILLIIIVAAVLRLYHIDHESLWLDEIYSMNVANPNQSFSELISEVNSKEGFPYLYFILLKLLFTIFGHIGVVARFFSVLFGVLSVYAIYKIGKKLINNNVGIVAALLVTFSEYCIAASQEARPYTFYFFSVIVCFYYLILFIEHPNRKHAIFYGVSVGFLLNTNFFGLANLFSQLVIIIVYIYLSPSKERYNFLSNAIISAGISLMMFIPNVVLFYKMLGFESGWIPAPTNESVGIIFKELLGNSEMTLFVFSVLIVFCFINIFNQNKVDNLKELKENRIVFSFTILFSWLFICVLLIFLKSYLDTSLMISRYFTSILPVLYLIISISFFMIRNLFVKIPVLICLLTFMWINHDIVNKYYDIPHKSQFREASEFVIKNHKKDDLIFTSLKYWFDYYFKNKLIIIEKPSLELIVNEMKLDSTKIKPFCYVDAHGRPFILSENAQQFLDNNFYIDKTFDGRDAWGKRFELLKNLPTIDILKYGVLKPENGSKIRYWIDSFEVVNNEIKINGWCYLDNQDALDSKIQLVLIKDGKALNVITQVYLRGDITDSVNKKFNLDNSGFKSKINLEKIELGIYKLGINITNKTTNTEGLILTDKTIVK